MDTKNLLIFLFFASTCAFAQVDSNSIDDRIIMATSNSIKKYDKIVEKQRENDPELSKIDKVRKKKNPKVLDKSRYKHKRKQHKTMHVSSHEESKDQKRIHKVKSLKRQDKKGSGPQYRDMHNSRQRNITRKLKDISKKSQDRLKFQSVERRAFDGKSGKKRRKRRARKKEIQM